MLYDAAAAGFSVGLLTAWPGHRHQAKQTNKRVYKTVAWVFTVSTVSDLIDLGVEDVAAPAMSSASAHQPGAGLLSRAWGRWVGRPADLCEIGQVYGVLMPLDKPVFAVEQAGQVCFSSSGTARLGGDGKDRPHETLPAGQADQLALPLLAALPPTSARALGDAVFCRRHGIRFAYMTGAMANGIASTELVVAVARAGLLGSFGAAGLDVVRIDESIKALQAALGDTPFCANLIFSPNETGQEQAVVNCYLGNGLRLIEASAYMDLTAAVVQYRVHGIHEDTQGRIVTPNRIIAKCSRLEVAEKWFSPPPDKHLKALLARGVLTAAEAELARAIPMAEDVTVEADSGGHTDNRPALALLPAIIALRDRLQDQYRYQQPLCVGLGGGIATPVSAAAAFAMGAAYIVTGTINQGCRESGSSDRVRHMLAAAGPADVVMAPAVDMFELGVKLQVLKRGSLFAMRANRLYELYRAYDSLEAIPAQDRQNIEQTIFRCSVDEVWRQTCDFFQPRDPAQLQRARTDARHRMALVFRWYLGLSSRWANTGVEDRQIDYQIWCGPAMGAFNEWTQGSFLQQMENRDVVTVAGNLIYGAALAMRITQLRQQGVRLAGQASQIRPLTPSQLEQYLL